MQDLDLDQYQQYLPSEGLKELFPCLVAMNEYAEQFGYCRHANWDNVLAHAHSHYGIICVKGPLKNLMEDRKDGLAVTSLFLHEYAHLELPDEWHTPRFAERNKELHKQFGVMHDRKAQAIGAIVVSVLIIAGGIGLYVATGWGWIGFGAGFAILANLGYAFNSFREEQIAAHEHDMRELQRQKD